MRISDWSSDVCSSDLEETPASPAELVRALVDAGVPAGTVNLVFGVPSEISEYLIPHPVIQKISFTGSTAVGKQLAALAGQIGRASCRDRVDQGRSRCSPHHSKKKSTHNQTQTT